VYTTSACARRPTGFRTKKSTKIFDIAESLQDAEIFGGRGRPQTYKFDKGSFVLVPHGVHQFDERFFKKSKEFDPKRFWSVSSTKTGSINDPGKRGEEEQVERGEQDIQLGYGTMHPFGGGRDMCKGKRYAETQVLIVVAGILSVWDFEPVSSQSYDDSFWASCRRWWPSAAIAGHHGTQSSGLKKSEVETSDWEHPGRIKQATFSVKPEQDCRVRARRREVFS